jgi:hypothetical protein
VKRLLNSQETSRVPDGCRLSMVPGPGAGHGHWRLVWDVQTEESPAVFVDDLPKQTARKDRGELNAILDAIYELQFSALVVDRFKTELTDNTALISKGTGPAVQGLLKVNDELKKQMFQLQ